MSPKSVISIAAALAIGAIPATAGAKAKQNRAPSAAGEASTIVTTKSNLGRMTPAKVRLRPARKADVSKLRRVKGAGKSARRHLRAALPAGKTVGAKILVLSPNGTDPGYVMWTSLLKTEGVPFTAIVKRDSALSTADLQTDADNGRYEGVILTTGSMQDWSTGKAVDTMSAAEWAALSAYEKSFNVRELNAYDYPQPLYGTNWGGNCGDKSGTTAQVTALGSGVFADLQGSFPIDGKLGSGTVYGCETTPVAGGSWQTLISGPNGAIVGTNVRTDGVETMFDSYSGADWTMYTRMIGHGMLSWLTKGVYLGMRRDYFGLDVDDVFFSNDRWDPTSNTTKSDDASLIRMQPSDVQRALAWEKQTGITLNMLFNSEGAQLPVTKGKKSDRDPGDPLSVALVANKNAFRWTSHTFSHAELDGADLATTEAEIKTNIDWATKNGIPFNKTELTTGGHSGLGNASMPQALTDTGIKVFGADQSRQPSQYTLGTGQSLPRWPTGVYYNVGTRAEQLDEYNYLNYEICGGGPGCLKAPADWDTYVNNEATQILRHILDNDPRPHYVHQANLAEDGTMYPVFDEVLKRVRAYLKTPLVQQSYTDAATTLAQQTAWAAAVAGGKVSGTISATGLTVTAADGIAVPVTGTRLGTLYGGLRSGWQKVAAGTTTLGF